MGSKFCVKFQRAPLKFHTKVWTLTPQNMQYTVFYICVWVTISLNYDVISLSETGPRVSYRLGPQPYVNCIMWSLEPEECITDTNGCDYLSMPLISASGTQDLIFVRFIWHWFICVIIFQRHMIPCMSCRLWSQFLIFCTYMKTDHRWKDQWCGKRFHVMTSSWFVWCAMDRMYR